MNRKKRFMAVLLLLAAAALPQAAFGQGAQRTVRIAAVHSQNGAVTSVDLVFCCVL